MTRRDFAIGAAAIGLAASVGSGVARAAKPKALDAIVLGAGVSGLNAAWLLEQEGMKVLVLEGRQRVGGRVLTLMDQPGYPEMGFNSMGEGYGRGIDAAMRAGVELENISPRFGGSSQELYLGGKRISKEEWARSPLNPFPDALKTAMPWEVVNRLVHQHNRLPDFNTWNDPANAALDISLHSFLKAQGLNDAAIRLAHDVSPYYGTSAYDVSALMLEFNDGFIAGQIAAGPRSLAVKGGNIKLPIGMAKLLKGDLLFGKEVVAIDSQTGMAEVRCADGSVYTAPRVICSLPFSTLRHIAITPGLSGSQALAVTTLRYNPITIAFLTFTEPFWESDGFAPGMFTDDHLGVVMPQRFGSDPANPTAITGLTVQARGQLAYYWDAMGKDAALQYVVQRLEALRPAAKGKVKGAAIHSWASERFNMGDWCYFAPGQIAAFAAGMAAPAGRIHFCGEHTAVGARGLEGAFESSERVALEVMTA
nr:NAD(P)/FAD-dependent oxidoreductase [Sphingobium boeckii]